MHREQASGPAVLRSVAEPAPWLPVLLWVLVVAAPASGQGPATECRTPHLLSRSGSEGREVRVDTTGRLCTRSPLGVRGAPVVGIPPRRPEEGDPPGAARAFATSFVLPGGGQWLQGQGRAYLYLGLELVAWGAFLEGRLDGSDLRDQYRDLAWRVARGGEGDARHVGDFRYYEALAEYPESGAWDRDPTRPGIQPETDPETYNGSVWSLARELFSLTGEGEPPDPEDEARALEYYREHGYGPAMAWDWSRDPDAVERYRHLIEESDDAFRRATIVLAVIATNHVLSAVDGFLSARIASDRMGRSSALRPSSRLPWGRTRWSFELRVGGSR